MITFSCDLCGEKSATTSNDFKQKPYNWTECTPGYVGTKLLCPRCYKLWIGVVKKFFPQT